MVSLELKGLFTGENSYRINQYINLTGKAYVIELLQFGISCSSTNFTVGLMNIDDYTLADSTNTILTYSSINKVSVNKVDNIIIRNRDLILTNKLYLHITNNAAIATGPITIELIYKNLQDRVF